MDTAGIMELNKSKDHHTKDTKTKGSFKQAVTYNVCNVTYVTKLFQSDIFTTYKIATTRLTLNCSYICKWYLIAT